MAGIAVPRRTKGLGTGVGMAAETVSGGMPCFGRSGPVMTGQGMTDLAEAVIGSGGFHKPRRHVGEGDRGAVDDGPYHMEVRGAVDVMAGFAETRSRGGVLVQDMSAHRSGDGIVVTGGTEAVVVGAGQACGCAEGSGNMGTVRIMTRGTLVARGKLSMAGGREVRLVGSGNAVGKHRRDGGVAGGARQAGARGPGRDGPGMTAVAGAPDQVNYPVDMLGIGLDGAVCMAGLT